MLKPTLPTLALASLVLLAATGPAGASARTKVPETDLKPATLSRGPDVAAPHLEAKTVVDGDVRLRIRAGMVRLLGKSGDEYVVGTSNKSGSGRFHTFRIDADGGRTPLIDGVSVFEMVLSADGGRIGLASGQTAKHSRLRVWDALNGDLEQSRRFPGAVSLLDFAGNRMVLGSWGPNRTLWWNVSTDRSRRIANRVGYIADIAADRFAFFTTKDPYSGGCSVSARLSDQHRLWRSCKERVDAFAPSGGRTAAVHILSDGLGPNRVRVHKAGGRLVASYTTAGWFGAVTWESPRALLLDTHGSSKTATVRCVLTDCERASDVSDNPSYRVSARERLSVLP